MSTAVDRPSLTRHVSPKERDELLRKAFDAFEKGDDDVGYSYLAQVPLIPALAEFVLETKGREYCETRFNLSEINKGTGKK